MNYTLKKSEGCMKMMGKKESYTEFLFLNNLTILIALFFLIQ
jgi:hypothetical protein